MRGLSFLILFFFVPMAIGILSAQQTKTDSLVVKLKTEKSDSMKCVVLNDLCFQLCYSYPDSAMDYGTQALELALKMKNNSLTGLSYNRIGIVYDIMSDWDTSLLCYEKAAYYAKRCSDTITLASAYNNMGLIYWNKVQYDLAVDYYLKSLELFQKIGKVKGVANTYNNISLIYWEQGDLQTALDYQHKSLVLRQELEDGYGIGASLVNLGMLYSEIDSFRISKRYLYKGISVKEKNGNDDHGLAIAWNNLALALHQQGEDDSVVYCYNKAAQLHLSNENHHGAASTYLNLGEFYQAKGDEKSGRTNLLLAEELESGSEGSKLLVTIYHALAKSYTNTGQFQLGTEYYAKYIALNDSLYNAENYEKLIEIENRYESEKKDREIAELKTSQTEKDLQFANDQLLIANKNKWLFGLGAGLVAILFISLYLVLRIKSKNEQEKNKLVIESKEKSLVAIFEATETERQRIAKDLHDGIGQQLSGLKLAWSKFADELIATDPAKVKRLGDLSLILDESATELREISHQMMPRVLSEMGLIPALKDMLDKSLGLSETEYIFDYYNLEDRLSERIEITLFRVAQELTNNIIKHSGAKKVNIQVFKNQDHVILIFEDDGKGLDENYSTTGHGFTNIKSRLDVVNGTFNLELSFKKGTVATIRVNLL